MNVLDEEDGIVGGSGDDNNDDSDNLFGYSGKDLQVDGRNNLDSLLSATGAGEGPMLDANFWANQSHFQARMQRGLLDGDGDWDGKESSEQEGLLARQKMDTHGLFGTSEGVDDNTVSSGGGSSGSGGGGGDGGGSGSGRKLIIIV